LTKTDRNLASVVHPKNCGLVWEVKTSVLRAGEEKGKGKERNERILTDEELRVQGSLIALNF